MTRNSLATKIQRIHWSIQHQIVLIIAHPGWIQVVHAFHNHLISQTYIWTWTSWHNIVIRQSNWVVKWLTRIHHQLNQLVNLIKCLEQVKASFMSSVFQHKLVLSLSMSRVFLFKMIHTYVKLWFCDLNYDCLSYLLFRFGKLWWCETLSDGETQFYLSQFFYHCYFHFSLLLCTLQAHYLIK